MARRMRENLPFVHLVPNLITILGLCCGLTAMRLTFDGLYIYAAALIVFAAAIDGLDGLVARRLRATSEMGAELDSLSDFVCFGVAPALLTYRFALFPDQGLGWVLALTFAICCCLRLARFNTMRDQPDAPRHFLGVPAPAGAGLGLLPVFATFAGLGNFREMPLLVALWLGFVGFLMISRIPTPSAKGLKIARDKARFLLIGVAICIGLMVTRFWLFMTLVCLIYLAVVLFQALRHRRF